MIKFFRKIRYDLMDKNKTGKYFKYAIGEIILVVIGILIALAINNWNEHRKTEQKLNQFLISLKSDLRNDLNEIKVVTEDQSIRSNMITKAIELSKKPNIKEIISKDSIMFYEAGRNFTFFPTVGAYNAATNSGLIDNINNEELKRSILNLYEHLYLRIAHNGVILDERTGQLDWESRGYIDVSLKMSAFDKNALLDKDFISQLNYVNRFVGLYLLRCKDTQSGIKEALMNIDKYLN
ncbi:MAG: hypothetical protein DA407_16300 [Bacteroidetes bacterium]|nr:MAG: hypothetical protein DA407_16300 [Bacteroidota bacterium]